MSPRGHRPSASKRRTAARCFVPLRKRSSPQPSRPEPPARPSGLGRRGHEAQNACHRIENLSPGFPGSRGEESLVMDHRTRSADTSSPALHGCRPSRRTPLPAWLGARMVGSPLGSLTAPRLRMFPTSDCHPACYDEHPRLAGSLACLAPSYLDTNLAGGVPVSRQRTHFSVSTASRKGIVLPTRLDGPPHLWHPCRQLARANQGRNPGSLSRSDQDRLHARLREKTSAPPIRMPSIDRPPSRRQITASALPPWPDHSRRFASRSWRS
jgi:hypothetical protein